MSQKAMSTKDHTGDVRVFVYGTLKSDRYNNPLLERNGAKFMGYDYLEGSYSLVDLGPFPAVYQRADVKPEITNRVYGELWAMDEEALAHLDYMEGHPNFYQRRKVWTALMEKRAWTYFQVAKPWEAEFETIEIWQPTKVEEKYWENYNAA